MIIKEKSLDWKQTLAITSISILMIIFVVIIILSRRAVTRNSIAGNGSDRGGKQLEELPNLSISSYQADLAGWKSINSDVEYVLYLNGVAVPVIKSVDNSEYLTNQSYVFLANTYKDGDQNMVIYGYSGKDNAVFSVLNDSSFMVKNTLLFIESEEGLAEYHLVAYFTVDVTESSLPWSQTRFSEDERFWEYLEKSYGMKTIPIDDVDYDFEYDEAITLVTYVPGMAESNKRTIVIMAR